MNIWFIHPYGTPYQIPGLHRPFEFGKYFMQKGNKVTVFSSSFLHFANKNFIEDNSKYLIKNFDGINTVFIKTSSYSGFFDRVINMFQFWKRMFKVAVGYAENYERPDVIIASSPHPMCCLSGLKLSKKFNVPCISEIRDLWPEAFFVDNTIKEGSFLARMIQLIEKKIYVDSNALVFLKEGDHEYITEHRWDTESGGKVDMSKCFYVNNAVDVELFDNRANSNEYYDDSLNNDKFKIIYSGTIRLTNHVDQLLDVAKVLGTDYEFIIYGTGNYEAEIKKRIRDENISNVYMKGYLENKYIPRVLKYASATILNYSDKDYNWSRGNSSNKLFEYLAAGKPVISTVKMGYDILEKYKCGISAEKCSTNEIANAIKKIRELKDEDYKNISINARKAANDFDINILAEKYLNIIKKTIKIYNR